MLTVSHFQLIENNDQLKLANQKEAQTTGGSTRPLTAVALNSHNTGNLAGTKTVVILPQNSSGAGDGGPQAKRIKQDIADPLGVAVNSLQWGVKPTMTLQSQHIIAKVLIII